MTDHTYTFAEPVTVSNVFQGQAFTETLKGSVTPKSEQQAFACEVAFENHPDVVTRKKKGTKA